MPRSPPAPPIRRLQTREEGAWQVRGVGVWVWGSGEMRSSVAVDPWGNESFVPPGTRLPEMEATGNRKYGLGRGPWVPSAS